MATSHRKGTGKNVRNQLESRDRHTLNVWVAAHAADLDDQPEAEIVARASAGTGLTLTIANILTARDATGAQFEVRKQRPARSTNQSELPLDGSRDAIHALALGMVALLEGLGSDVPGKLRALADGAA